MAHATLIVLTTRSWPLPSSMNIMFAMQHAPLRNHVPPVQPPPFDAASTAATATNVWAYINSRAAVPRT